MVSPAVIEPILRNAIDEARADGWTIVRDVTVDRESKSCSAIGALYRDGFAPLTIAAYAWGLPYDAVKAIAFGLDGLILWTLSEANRPYYDLGRRLWEYAEATR